MVSTRFFVVISALVMLLFSYSDFKWLWPGNYDAPPRGVARAGLFVLGIWGVVLTALWMK